MLLSYKYINSPVGQLKLVANENALVAVLWDNENQNVFDWQSWSNKLNILFY